MKYLLIILGLINLSFSQVGERDQLKNVFSYDMINSEIDYFEQFSGPAKGKYSDSREYKIGGCTIDVQLYENSTSIRSIYTQLSDQCSPDFSDLVSNFNISKPLKDMTFGDLDSPKYYADCLISCGRASSSIYASLGGSKADDWEVITLGADINDLDYPNWWNALMKNGEDWILDQKFNCEDNYSDIAHNDLKNQNVTSITISKSPLDFHCFSEAIVTPSPDIQFYQANDIYNVYKENEALGNKLFKGQEVFIIGTVKKVRNHGYTDEVIIALSVGNSFNSIDLTMKKGMDDYAYLLRKGQEIKVKCIGAEKFLDPKFINCQPL